MISRTFDKMMRLVGVNRREASSVFLMTLYFFLAMAAVSILKSVQNAVYLGRVGFDWRLPTLYLVLAGVSMAVVGLLGRLANRFSRHLLSLVTLVIFTTCVPVFFVLLNREASLAYPLFYIFGGVFSVLVPTQGWMLSYEFFSYRQAKRLFSLLGTGGILGGAGGGFYVAGLARLGIEDQWLLVHVGVILLGMQGLLFFLGRSGSLSPSPHLDRNREDPFLQERPVLALRSSSYLKYLASVVLMSACLSTLIDLQYKWVLDDRYAGSSSSITQFFGYLLGSMFLFSALFQLLATTRMLRRFGVAITAMALPVALLLGSIPVVIWAAFGTVVLLKVLDGCLRSSLHKTSTELLFMPVYNEGTVAVKGFIDLVVFRMGDALAAALFLALLNLPGTPMKWIGALMTGTAVIWLLIAQRLSHEYLKGLRSSLELGAANLDVSLELPPGGEAEAVLVAALEGRPSHKVRFALQELIKRMPQRGEAQWSSTQGDTSVYQLFQPQAPPWLPKVERLLEHSDQQIVAGALHLLVGYDSDKYRDRLEDLCTSSSRPDLLGLIYLDQFSSIDGRQVETEKLLEWCQAAGLSERRVLASLLGKQRSPECQPVLGEWVASEDRALARAALRALGHSPVGEYTNLFLEHLRYDWSRAVARAVLAKQGDQLVPALFELARKMGTPSEIQREIPLILTEVGSAQAQESLLALLYVSDPLVSYRALKGLNKIRTNRKLVFGEEALLPILQIWAQHHYELVNLQQMLGEPENREEKLLKKTTQERLQWSMEKIFRGLELFLPAGDAYFSYLGFTGDDPGLRENAVELLDLRVRGEIRKTILPILAGRNPAEIAREGRLLFNLSSNFERVLSDTLFIADPWLKCCIIAVVRHQKRDNLQARVRTASEDVHPVVRETARWALEVLAR